MVDSIDRLEKALDGFCGEASELNELRRLVAQLPENIGALPSEIQSRAQPVILQALYYLGDLKRLEHYATRSSGPEADLWFAYALFDSARYAEAAERFRAARAQLSLYKWAQCKVDELLLCCRVYTQATTLNLNEFRELGELRERAAEHAPIPAEMQRALNWATGSGTLTEDEAQRFANALGMSLNEAGARRGS